jgi:antitoxin VapB
MSLVINSPETDRLARELVEQTGEALEEAVAKALRERLDRERRRAAKRGTAEALLEIGRRVAALPVLDARTADEIIDYDEKGVPR